MTQKSGFVALVGRPNAGKSTLLNRLIGQKIAITSRVAQTTRYRIKGILQHPQGQAVLLDTPGFSKAQDALTHYLVEQAKAGLSEADALLWVVDATLAPGTGDAWMATQLSALNKPVILALNKADRLAAKPAVLQQHTDAYSALLAAPPVLWVGSALTGKRVKQLPDLIINLLPEGPLYYDPEVVTDQRLRELAAEMIREQVLRQTQEEIPHSVAVLLDSFDESDPACVRITATLVVNQPSQKKILVGHKGEQIKHIGMYARRSIEGLLNQPVFLGLTVEVRKNWRRDARFIELMHGPKV
jgi:GTP-binding protein Era